jgi:OPA family glycerol-3-phosphate transporter-like MFS transporter
VEAFLLKDRPGLAGHADFDTGDASSGEDDKPIAVLDLYKRILGNPVILTLCIVEFCTGVLRNGTMHWVDIYIKTGASEGGLGLDKGHFLRANWGLILMVAGIIGGNVAGIVSDKLFQSRRAPAAALLYGVLVAGSLVMGLTLDNAVLLGTVAFVLQIAVIGTHGLLSGTATMDFGGRKGAATAVGVIDGFVYLGTAVQSFALGWLTEKQLVVLAAVSGAVLDPWPVPADADLARHSQGQRGWRALIASLPAPAPALVPAPVPARVSGSGSGPGSGSGSRFRLRSRLRLIRKYLC